MATTKSSPRRQAVQPKVESMPAKPPWLIDGDYESPVWQVVDTPISPKPAMRIRWDVQLFDPKRPNEICRLTDQDCAHLLDTIKRQTVALRTGRHATLTAADTHEEIARQSVNWVLWMIANSIYRFSDLNEDDFMSYLQSAIYGPGHLFGFAERLTNYVDSLKSKGEDLPTVQRSGVKLKSL